MYTSAPSDDSAPPAQTPFEEESRERQARFDAFFNGMFEFMGLLAPDGTLLEANRAALEFGGLHAADVIGRPFWEARWWSLTPETGERLRAAVSRAAAGEFVRHEAEIVGAGGRVLPIDLSLNPVRDPSTGRVTYLVSGGRDISERRALEEALRAGERRMNEAQEAARIGSWEFDVATGRISWSRETFRLLGFDPEEGEPDYETLIRRYHPDDAARHEAAVRRAIEDGAPYDVDLRVLQGDGTARWVRGAGRARRDAEGRVVCLLGTVHDITARKEQEERLRLSEERFRSLAEATTMVVWVADVSGAIDMNVPAWRAFSGQSAQEARGQGWLDALHAEDRKRAVDAWAHSVRTAAPYEHEFLARRSDGEWRWLRARAVPVRSSSGGGAAGEIREWVGTCQDVTEARRSEEERSRLAQEAQQARARAEEHAAALLAQTGELERARDAALSSTRARSAFLANVSHEIRTPMNGVLGMLGMLLEMGLTPEQRDFAQTAHDNAQSLLRVLNNVLDCSKIEAGKLDLECVPFSLRQVVEGVTGMMRGAAARKSLLLADLLYPDTPDALVGDPGRLRQILFNLVGNAVKFTEHGEVIVRVRAEAAPGGATAGGGVLLRFEVSDTGVGVPADRQGRLFEDSSQADPSTARLHGDTGLGLAICRHLADQMGGEIGVRSEEGRGSTFWFTARFGRQDTAAATTAAAAAAGDAPAAATPPSTAHGAGAPAPGTHRVLVVVDEPAEARAFSAQLRQAGIVPVVVGDAGAALDATRRGASGSGGAALAFDAAIVVHGTGGVDGLELARALRQAEAAGQGAPSVRLPLLLLTPTSLPGGAAEAAGAGVDLCMTRSTRLAVVLAAVRGLIGGVIAADATEAAGRPAGLAMNTPDAPEASGAPAEPLVLGGAMIAVSPGGDRRHTRVLLAEDNPINQKVVMTLLSKRGYCIESVGNGLEAVEALHRGNYDVVLMDCQMPEMDGWEATRRIREWETCSRPAQARVPIIALTACAMLEDQDRAMAAGMDDFLTKPVKADHLCETVERWVRASGPAPSAPERELAPVAP